MANPRRNKPVQTSVTLADLLSIFRGTPADTPRQRAKLADIETRMNLPETLPDQTTNLLQAQPRQAAASLMALSPMTDVTTQQTQDIGSLIQPLLSQPKDANNLLTEKEEKEIAKDPVALRKFSRAGNAFAQLGGFREASPELLAQATPEELDIYNKQKLAARNKGIGEMLLMLSDALGGRDVAMRALERQQARQPAKEELTAAQRNYQTYLEIAQTGTPKEIQLAASALLGIRQGKSKEQLRNEVIAALTKQNNPITGEPYSEEDINEQIKILDKFYGNAEQASEPESPPLQIDGYTITEG